MVKLLPFVLLVLAMAPAAIVERVFVRWSWRRLFR